MAVPLSKVVPGQRKMLLRPCMQHVAQENGKSPLRQLLEMMPLVLGGQRISPEDYYRLRLYDDTLSSEQKRQFIGNNRYWELDLRVNDRRWASLVDDKLNTAALLATHGIRTPSIRAIYHPVRTYPGARSSRTPQELARYLRSEGATPFFGKPSSGGESLGVVLAESYDATSDVLRMGDGTTVAVDVLAQRIHEASREQFTGARFDAGLGYLLQEVVVPHPLVASAIGPRVASLRMTVLLEPRGPIVLCAVWKVPAIGNVADNPWRPGNWICDVDLQTGRVQRAVEGTGPELVEHTHHPATGREIVGMVVPEFASVVDTVVRGATLFPGIRLQGWDVAIDPSGPVVLEVNAGSGLPTLQIARQRGLMTAEFQRFLRRAETSNPTRPRGPGLWFHPHLHGHRMGRLRGAFATASAFFGLDQD